MGVADAGEPSSLARVLAQVAMMQSVADAYQRVRAAATAPQGTWLQRLAARFGGHQAD
jgi:hypothetical protein